MYDAAPLPLMAARWTPFDCEIEFEGYDFTGATFAMQVRDRRDGGFVRATLATVTGDVEGVRLLSVTTTADLPTSIIRILIAEATMEAMNNAGDAGLLGQDGVAWWDMHVTPAGGRKFVAAAGPFTIVAGSTL